MRLKLYTALAVCAAMLSACAAPVTQTQTDGALTQTGGTQAQTDGTQAQTDAPDTEEGREVMNYRDIKAMWLSQFDLSGVYCRDGVQRDEEGYVKMIRRIIQKAADTGINTVIVQVRPNADSMYPSEFYPPSKYAFGEYGASVVYDPFEIIVDTAHEASISVHAWINPMRAMTIEELERIDGEYPIRRWYDDTEKRGKYILTVNNNWYLNPAYDEVRQLILNGAEEILKKYEVDGLHMDDYFYPTTEASFDASAYSEYKKGGGELSRDDFRRDCLNRLVSSLYKITKSYSPELLFGISPAGVIQKVQNVHYADIYRWCSEDGYIDYICPQIYFGMEHQTCAFSALCRDWQRLIKTDSVKLIIGMTLGKAQAGTDAYAGTGKNEWSEHKDILLRCLQDTEKLNKCTGVSYFCYQYFYNPQTGAQNAATRAERENFVPLLKTISWND